MKSIALIALSLCCTVGCAPTRGEAYQKAMAEAGRAHHAGRYEAAAERFDEAARTAKVPRDAVRARFEAALARAQAGDAARASQELHALADAKPPTAYSGQAAYKAADLAWKSDPAAGYAELEAVALRFPEDPVARVALARVIRHDDEGGPAATLAHLDALGPKFARTSLEGLVAYERAKRLADLDRPEAARDAFLDIAKRWPYPVGPYFDDALYRAAELEEKLGHYREAVEHLERLLSFRESSTMIGTYERPRYVPAMLLLVKLYDEKLNERAKARETLHRLYTDFKTSTLRDDALWREAGMWLKDGDADKACDRLSTLTSDFPDSRYVPCAIDRCSSIKRPAKSKAPKTCRPYVTRDQAPASEADAKSGEDSAQ